MTSESRVAFARLKALGNGIVPEAAYWVFRALDAAGRME